MVDSLCSHCRYLYVEKERPCHIGLGIGVLEVAELVINAQPLRSSSTATTALRLSIEKHEGVLWKGKSKQMPMTLPVQSENPEKVSSSVWQASMRLLKRVPTGSRGCPTQPSRLVIEVMLL